MKNIREILLLIIGLLASQVNSSKILIISHQPYVNRQTIAKSLAEDLAARNHSVTLFTTHRFNISDAKIEQINFEATAVESDAALRKRDMNWWQKFHYMLRLHAHLESSHRRSPLLQKILENQIKFDLLVIDCVVCSLVEVAEAQAIPAIYLSSAEPLNRFHDHFGNDVNPSLHPETQILGYKHGSLDLLQRLNSFVAFHYMEVASFFLTASIEKLSFMLAYTHPNFGNFRPLVMNVVQIGFTYGERGEKGERSEEVEAFLRSPKPAILMDVQGLEQAEAQKFFNAFAQLPFNVVWASENGTSFGAGNILYVNGDQKLSILSHSRVKLLITAGDMLDVEKAVLHAVPMLLVPLARDQFVTAHNLEALGVAAQIDFDELGERALVEKIGSLVENFAALSENCRQLRAIAMSRPKQKEAAAWYVEYVLRWEGAEHLRYPGSNVPYYQKHFYDVYLFIAGCVYLLVRYRKVSRILRRLIFGAADDKLKVE